MKIAFFGNADFGLNTLIRVLDSSDHQIVGVITNKDKKIGRNRQKTTTPIKKIAIEKGLNLIEQDNLLDIDFIRKIKRLDADIFLVIAYKLMPKSLYSLPKYGSVNLHASLLPEYKGPSPIQRAIISNEKKTGLSSFFIDDSIDGGKLILQKEVEIFNDDNFQNLWERLSSEGGDFILKTLELVKANKKQIIEDYKNLTPSYASKIRKKELLIDWSQPAQVLLNKIRAFSPYPCMYTYHDKKRIKIVSASEQISSFSKLDKIDEKKHNLPRNQRPGTFLLEDFRLFVKCSDLFIEILALIPESKSILSAKDFINGFIRKTNLKKPNEFR